MAGYVTIADDVIFQCISVSIQNDRYNDQHVECFTFRISAAHSVSGLTLDPAQASVCITDQDGMCLSLQLHMLQKILPIIMPKSIVIFDGHDV